MRRWIKRLGVAFIIALMAVQFVPVNRTNPPVEGKPVMSAELEPLFDGPATIVTPMKPDGPGIRELLRLRFDRAGCAGRAERT